jgi:hypothetical protein
VLFVYILLKFEYNINKKGCFLLVFTLISIGFAVARVIKLFPATIRTEYYFIFAFVEFFLHYIITFILTWGYLKKRIN